MLSQPPRTFEAGLNEARALGIISNSQHDSQLRSFRAESAGGGGGTLVALPTRKHGVTQRLDLKDQWHTVPGTFGTQHAARRAVKAREVVHGNNGGDWKCNTFSTGPGSKAYYHCNGHKDCPVLLRFRRFPLTSVDGPSEEWCIQVTDQVCGPCPLAYAGEGCACTDVILNERHIAHSHR